jgi:hypothetical protein
VEDEALAGETTDPDGERVVLFDAVWSEKIARDHPEIGAHLCAVLRAVSTPDHVAPDPIFADRTRYYARGAGPSQWLLVVVRYEQTLARIVSAFSNPEGSQVMERTNITIGPLSLDHANYDADSDVLYLRVGAPQPAEDEEAPEGHVVRYAPGTSRIVGLMLGARHVLDRDGHLAVTVPETVETTAEQLVPPLAAV